MRFFATVLLLLGSVCSAQAQISTPGPIADEGSVAQDFSTKPAAKAKLIRSLAVADALASAAVKPASPFAVPVVATALSAPLEAADPPTPSPKPKFIYRSRGDYRWQLGFGVAWMRFRSSIFEASAVGIKTSVTYFANEWLGVEGNVAATFAPEIFDREHVKLLVYGAGPKVAWRQRNWEPWLHGIFGGSHEQPQTDPSPRNSFSIQAGGGADYRWTQNLSLRLEGDYVRTAFFHRTQNNFELDAGFVLHF